jgi:signal transduction histidine kinase/ABC-type branched-subunit amino acid transport system ATPase component
MTAPAVGARPGPAWPLLSVSGLAVQFGALRALDGVDLVVQPGELVALAGENGAGKTTLVRCVAGDIAPTSGRILLSGKPVLAEPLSVARQGVAVVWQDLALCDNLDVASNLLLGQERRRHLLSDTRFHAAAAALIDELGIPLEDTTRGARALSGGQRQLLAVARAMARKPRLLLLDEPSASLGVQAARQVEELIIALRDRGTAILLACHDIEQMFRLADRIVVLRHGRVVADVEPGGVHPDDIMALLSGQQVDSSARRQLTRLHGLVDRLVSADPSSSLSLILSALGAALGSECLCIHLRQDGALVCAASLGVPPALLSAWSRLPSGPAGGPVGLAAVTERPVVQDAAQEDGAWAPFSDLARTARVASSWSVPVMGPGGLAGVITVFRAITGTPPRDQLDLVTLYAGYAASAIERDRLLAEVTARNRVLETIREMLETLAGPIPVADGIVVALQSLRRGLQADEVVLLSKGDAAKPRCRAFAGPGGAQAGAGAASPSLLATADQVRAVSRRDGVAYRLRGHGGEQFLAVTFAAPAGPAALLAQWRGRQLAEDATALIEDAAHSLRLALEREEAGIAHQEAAALRRSQELQRGFLSRLSHELRTPLTAIQGYASSLLQPDVTWDGDSQQRFLARIAAESARLGRLVDDLLDFSAIESGILRLQRDWCDIPLVLEAAIACLPPAAGGTIDVHCDADLPVVWADHDRLEQVFVNLLDNAFCHNPPGTRVRVGAAAQGTAGVAITVADDGAGLPAGVATAPFEPMRRRRSRTAGAGLGLSIANGIVAAHGGRIEHEQPARGTRFRVWLPVELPGKTAGKAVEPPPEAAPGPDGHGRESRGSALLTAGAGQPGGAQDGAASGA